MLRQGVDHMDCLRAVPLFRECTNEFLEMLAEQVVSKVFACGDIILQQGDFGDSMYVLNKGEVEIVAGDVSVATLGAGSVFGEMAAICKDPVAARRSATVKAKNFCDCRVIQRDGLMRTLSRFPVEAQIIELERQKRFADLRNKGVLPKEPTRTWNTRPAEEAPGSPRSPWSPKTKAKLMWSKALCAIEATHDMASSGGITRRHTSLLSDEVAKLSSPNGVKALARKRLSLQATIGSFGRSCGEAADTSGEDEQSKDWKNVAIERPVCSSVIWEAEADGEAPPRTASFLEELYRTLARTVLEKPGSSGSPARPPPTSPRAAMAASPLPLPPAAMATPPWQAAVEEAPNGGSTAMPSPVESIDDGTSLSSSVTDPAASRGDPATAAAVAHGGDAGAHGAHYAGCAGGSGGRQLATPGAASSAQSLSSGLGPTSARRRPCYDTPAQHAAAAAAAAARRVSSVPIATSVDTTWLMRPTAAAANRRRAASRKGGASDGWAQFCDVVPKRREGKPTTHQKTAKVLPE